MIFQLYKDTQRQWRWRLKAPNGNTIAESGEAYHNKKDALRGIDIVKGEATSKGVIHDIPAEIAEAFPLEDVELDEVTIMEDEDGD
jgi:uncharacterized protein